jgi:dihydroxy-acid dehydratase
MSGCNLMLEVVTGHTMGEKIAGPRDRHNEVIHPLSSRSIRRAAAFLLGNLAPMAQWSKRRRGAGNDTHTGPARSSTRRIQLSQLLGGQVQDGEVVVIRYEGQRAAPGMLRCSCHIGVIAAGLGRSVAWSRMGGFSGATQGACVATSTEAYWAARWRWCKRRSHQRDIPAGW